MPATHIPVTPQDISAVWLTNALRRSGVITNAAVEKVEAQVIGVGLGFTSQLARLTVGYEDLDAVGPRSMIAKAPSLHQSTREAMAASGVYERELRFYERLAPSITLTVPRCYFNASDPETGDFVLLLEDLATTATSRQIPEDACSVEDADFAVRQLAKLHAAWWEAPALDKLSWIPNFNSRAEEVRDSFVRLWPVFLDRWGSFIPDSMHRIGELIGEHIVYVKDYLSQSPRTLLHGDFRLDNMFFNEMGQTQALALLDWQGYRRGMAAYDVAYFIGEVVDAGRHVTDGVRLLASYHDALVGAGIRGYTFEQCHADYRVAHIERAAFVVRVCASLDLSSSREQQLAERGVRNMVASLVELDAVELLPG